MLGAIAGDIIGSRFERNSIKTKKFDLFAPDSRFTDDTVLTLAIATSILTARSYQEVLKEFYRLYPDAGYGAGFKKWAATDHLEPYRSFGNGAAMRVSPVGFAFDSLPQVLHEAKQTAIVSHNHPEGIKAAQAVAAAIFLARKTKSKATIRNYITDQFNYDLDRRLESIRPVYKFDVTCQGSVPEAIIAFLESTGYEDTVRNAVSLGGDSDTQACIAGAIAQAFYDHIPNYIRHGAIMCLDAKLRAILFDFEVNRLWK